MSKRDSLVAVAGDLAETRTIRLVGRFAQTLEVLHDAGPRGVTALEISTWALRLSHYVFILRRDFGLDIETVMEPHDGGQHARYILHTPVRIVAGSRRAAA